MYLRNWIDCGIKYVKDILNENGEPMDENELMNNVHDKRNIIADIYIKILTITWRPHGPEKWVIVDNSVFSFTLIYTGRQMRNFYIYQIEDLCL